MNRRSTLLAGLTLFAAAFHPAQAAELPDGFVSLFDGKTLDGWEGDRSIWSVRDGAITGQTTAATKLTENCFLVWKDEVENFELRMALRLDGGNSGIYYRKL